MVADTKKKYKKRRREDEKISARVDDIIFYALKKHGYSVLPVTDINMQKRGVDVVLLGKNPEDKPLLVDIKSAIRYWNVDLQTFSFEIQARNNKSQSGWFISPFSVTTDYLLVYVRAQDEKLNRIDNIECLLIHKSDVRDYIQNTFSIDDTLKILETKGEMSKRSKFVKISDDLKIVQSNQLYEKPVNILVSRDALRSLAYDRIVLVPTRNAS